MLEKFRTVNMNAMRTSFKKAGIDVSFAKTSSGQAESRGRIEKLSYQGEKGRVEVTSPEQLEQAIRTNRSAVAEYWRGCINHKRNPDADSARTYWYAAAQKSALFILPRWPGLQGAQLDKN